MKKSSLYFILRNLAALSGISIFILFEAYSAHSPSNIIWQYLGSFYLFYLWIVIHNLFLLNKLLLKRKYVPYIVITIAGLFLMTFLERWAFKNTHRVSFATYFMGCILYTVIGTAIYLAYKYVTTQRQFYQLNFAKRDLELKQLKSQLNPHFLFNALNNIYSYNLENNKYGNDLILKLSELMRYIVETSGKDTIDIKEEIKFIENYIVFERERLQNRCSIRYVNELGNVDMSIPPLLLFPFVENAFKHGTNTIDHSDVEILMKRSGNGLNLIVSNSIVKNNLPSTKQGLVNAKRRLELLYAERYTLVLKNEGERFTVDLSLN